LISGIIFTRLAAQTFSFSDFYIRRIKRIFPALILVLLASLVMGWLVLLRDEYINLGEHIAAGAAFVSNIIYWQEIDYFNRASELKPLLHLWSLGIEEQFYIIWPPLLYFAWRRRWNFTLVLWLMMVASFCTNVWAVSTMPVATFYLPVTRFWELLVGSWLAYSQIIQKQHIECYRKRGVTKIGSLEISLANLKAGCGLLLLAVPLIGLHRELEYPGWWALLPTIGTFLLISANQEAWVNRNLLSSRLLVFIGLISYPLYLWHWPLLSFVRILWNEDSGLGVLLAALLLSFCLSWLTMRLVETPIRFSQFSSAKLVTTLLFALSSIGLLGLESRLGAFTVRLDTPAIDQINLAVRDWSFPKDINYKKNSGFRLVEIPGTTKSVVLFIGDSHIEQYIGRVKHLIDRRDFTTNPVTFATHESCPPIPDVNVSQPGVFCDKFFDFAIDEAKKETVQTVVFGAFWESYFVGEYSVPGFKENLVYYTKDPLKRPLKIDDIETLEVFRHFDNQLVSLRRLGKNIWIILSNPTSRLFDPHHMLSDRLNLIHPIDTHAFISRTEFANYVRPVDRILKYIASSTGCLLYTLTLPTIA
jgi:peptidoglycan/LPS O-acetylase OafA/YrhL